MIFAFVRRLVVTAIAGLVATYVGQLVRREIEHYLYDGRE